MGRLRIDEEPGSAHHHYNEIKMNKKYFSVHEVDESVTSIFALPDNLYVHTKTCDDGVALAIFEGDNVHGVQLHADIEFQPLLKDLIEHKKEHFLEKYMLSHVMVDVHEFYADNERIFIIEAHIDEWEAELNYYLARCQTRRNHTRGQSKKKKHKLSYTNPNQSL